MERMGRVRMKGRWAQVLVGAVACLVAGGPAGAQEMGADGEGGGGLRPELEVGFEAKLHYRDSDENRFPVGFPFSPPMLPVGQTQGFLETVDPGSHLEVSVLSVFLTALWSEALEAHAKVDVIDVYDRNPTSEDRNVDVDELWIRFGRASVPAVVPERPGIYLKAGKMPKFERQNDRHLESYGLVSTAFNRFEDIGVELGADLGRFLYVRASATQGNPLFIRDPNALAGDNGIAELMQANPDPELGSGIVILYDAEVEDLDTDGELELGAGLGLRFGDAAGINGVDVLVWRYQRDLAETVDFHGTFYGGDLDLLRGPLNQFPLAAAGVQGNEKEETGANVWVYLGGFSFFGQYVDQEVAGLPRTGWEAEVAWRFDLPLVWGVGGRQLFPWIAPAARYSELEPDFAGNPQSPSPSVSWPWEKLDLGLRLGIIEGIDLTIEYTANEFTLASGAVGENDELLTTLRWRM